MLAILRWSLSDGWRRFVTALSLWAVARLLAAYTWRDAKVSGQFGAEQLVLIVLLVGCLGALLLAGLRRYLKA